MSCLLTELVVLSRANGVVYSFYGSTLTNSPEVVCMFLR